MQLLSINVARPRLIQYQGETLSTAIYKQPVEGRVEVGSLGIAGDDQADKSVHGGADKAVYAYTAEAYQWWREQLGGGELPPGEFGENLTTAGLLDGQVRIGDRYRIGSVLLEVTQPRQPCLKLGIKMGDATFVKRFHQAAKPGFYLRVLEPGTMAAGDAIELVHAAPKSLTVSEIYRLRFDTTAAADSLRHAAELPGLSGAWRESFCKLLASHQGD